MALEILLDACKIFPRSDAPGAATVMERFSNFQLSRGADTPVDPIILGELRFGILILPRGWKRAVLERWFEAGVGRLHCLPWDADTSLKWAELLARLRTTGNAMAIKDSLIAATATIHGLAIATRNRVDFSNAGVRIVDPFVAPE